MNRLPISSRFWSLPYSKEMVCLEHKALELADVSSLPQCLSQYFLSHLMPLCICSDGEHSFAWKPKGSTGRAWTQTFYGLMGIQTPAGLFRVVWMGAIDLATKGLCCPSIKRDDDS